MEVCPRAELVRRLVITVMSSPTLIRLVKSWKKMAHLLNLAHCLFLFFLGGELGEGYSRHADGRFHILFIYYFKRFY